MIITIGRQFGSGGKEIGEKVAERLGYAFYDKEIVTMAAEESGFSASAMQHYDEKPSGSLIYSLYMTGAATSDNLPLNQQLAFAQFNIIRKVAQADNCVIVGRCADYVLREKKNLLTVFLHAPMEYRVGRVMRRTPLTAPSLRKRPSKSRIRPGQTTIISSPIRNGAMLPVPCSRWTPPPCLRMVWRRSSRAMLC